MAIRTLGWVQNPNKLNTLKNVVSVFTDSDFRNDVLNIRLPILLKNNRITQENYDSFINDIKTKTNFSYEELKGKGANGSSRKNALCSGIVQVCIDGQKNVKYIDLEDNEIEIKKLYTDDWSADGYIRWAIATGLLKYDRTSDTCSITDLGKELASTEKNSAGEIECFTKALLSYPPVIRILTILSDEHEYTKFELGAKLGFKEELGFTSIPQNMFTYAFLASPISTRSEIRSNMEGDSDKYARTITNWLKQMNWVSTDSKLIHDNSFNQDVEIQTYKITPLGLRALKLSKGYSSNPRIKKIVSYEMLASNKASNANYLRKRRGLIIQSLNTSKTLDNIKDFLTRNGLDESSEAIKDEIDGLTNIGLEFSYENNKYKLLDEVKGLEVPAVLVQIDELTTIQNRVRQKLTSLNHDYLSLINIAYGNTSSSQNDNAREFEIETAKLFTDELGFEGMRLGDANRPDVIISYQNNGTIIDNKAYSDGFSLDRHCSDEMSRYILENQRRTPNNPPNEWWKNFKDEVNNFTYLFITSFLKGQYEANLNALSNNTNSLGAAIGIENLLYLANEIKEQKISKPDFFRLFANKELYSPLN